MNDMVLKKAIAETLCEEYITSIPSYDSDHVFSDSFNRKMDKLIARRRKAYYPIIKTTGRRVAAGLVAAALMGTVTVAAYEPARTLFKEFFIDRFVHHDTVKSVQNKETPIRNEIEKEYRINVPADFDEISENSVNTNELIERIYVSPDDKVIRFQQQIASKYVMEVDNEQAELVSKNDRDGNEILVYYDDSALYDYTMIIWYYDGYAFTLSGDLNETDMMDVYYSLYAK